MAPRSAKKTLKMASTGAKRPQDGPKKRFSLRGPPLRSNLNGFTSLKLTLVGKMMLRCLKMPLRSQLDPNMTPTWPSLGPPEGQSDL